MTNNMTNNKNNTKSAEEIAAEEIAEGILDKACDFAPLHVGSGKGISVYHSQDFYNELGRMIAAAIKEAREQRVALPDRETFKHDLGLKDEPRGVSYNKGAMDAYDALAYKIKRASDTLEPQKNQRTIKQSDVEKVTSDLKNAHCVLKQMPSEFLVGIYGAYALLKKLDETLKIVETWREK